MPQTQFKGSAYCHPFAFLLRPMTGMSATDNSGNWGMLPLGNKKNENVNFIPLVWEIKRIPNKIGLISRTNFKFQHQKKHLRTEHSQSTPYSSSPDTSHMLGCKDLNMPALFLLGTCPFCSHTKYGTIFIPYL